MTVDKRLHRCDSGRFSRVLLVGPLLSPGSDVAGGAVEGDWSLSPVGTWDTVCPHSASAENWNLLGAARQGTT